jgi:hypothetical protein
MSGVVQPKTASASVGHLRVLFRRIAPSGSRRKTAFARGPEALAREGLVHHAEDRIAALQEADQGAPEGVPHDERPRPVDGIENPVEFAVASVVGVFFADDAMTGELKGEVLAHCALGGLVGARHRIERPGRGLVLHSDRAPEMGQHGLRREIGQFVSHG